MGKNRKTYSEAFKKQVAIEAMDSKQTVAEIAAKYDVSPSMVCTWKKTFLDGGFSKEQKRLQKELEKKDKDLAAATMALGKAQLEIELIKKKLNIKD